MDTQLDLASRVAARSLSLGGMALPAGGKTSPQMPLLSGPAEGRDAAPESAGHGHRPPLLAGNQQIEKALAELNTMMRDRQRELEFSIDEASGRIILRVKHAESGEVIRQIPAEELLNISRAFIEGTGSLINDEA